MRYRYYSIILIIVFLSLGYIQLFDVGNWQVSTLDKEDKHSPKVNNQLRVFDKKLKQKKENNPKPLLVEVTQNLLFEEVGEGQWPDSADTVDDFKEVLINKQLLDHAHESLAVGEMLETTLIDGTVTSGIVVKNFVDVNGCRGITVGLESHDGFLYMSYDGSKLLAQWDIYDSNKIYTLVHNKITDMHFLTVTGHTRLKSKPCGAHIEDQVQKASNFIEGEGNDNISNDTVVDLMIIYTADAKQWVNNNRSGINNQINFVFQRCNTVYVNSETDTRFRLVHSYETSYQEVDTDADLDGLTFKDDGVMEDVHTKRNTYGADIVSLWAKIGFTGGVAWLTNGVEEELAFNLCRIQQLHHTYTFAHECGHNLGCGHAKSQSQSPGPGEFSYAAGWYVGNSYHTVMSYDEQQEIEIPYFSNPDVSYEGNPTGNNIDGDNARCIRNTKSGVSGYRSTKVSDDYFQMTVSTDGLDAICTFTDPNNSGYTGAIIKLTANTNGFITAYNGAYEVYTTESTGVLNYTYTGTVGKVYLQAWLAYPDTAKESAVITSGRSVHSVEANLVNSPSNQPVDLIEGEVYTGTSSALGETDYYNFSLNSTQVIDLSLSFNTSSANLDLYLYDSQFNLIQKSDSSTDSESLSEELTSGNYTMMVINSSGNSVSYDVLFKAGRGSTGYEIIEANQPKSGTLYNDLNSDSSAYFEINVSVLETINLSLEFLHSSGNADLYLYDSSNNELASSTSLTDNESLSLELNPGTYKVKVDYFMSSMSGPTLNFLINWSSASANLPRYRLYNRYTNSHFYTISYSEYQYLISIGWSDEGAPFSLFSGDTEVFGVKPIPYYRLYDLTLNKHFWTSSLIEYNSLGTVGWTREGIAGYLLPESTTDTTALYRLYNQYTNKHFWTTSSAERTQLLSLGWTYEGVSGYVKTSN